MYPELDTAKELAARYLETLNDRAVTESPTMAALRERLDKPPTGEGLPGDQVLRELAEDIEGGLLHMAGPRFYGWVIGGSTPAALGADWLVSTWDQNSAAYACSPGAAVLEEITGAWLKELLLLPPAASYSFVTGCQMAHVVCLMAARHQVLQQAGWNVEEDGLFGAPRIRVLVGEHHETLLRALRYVGLGSKSVQRVDCLEDGTINTQALQSALAENPGAPTIVSLAAGDLNRGAFDDFDRVCDLAHAQGAWVHVDGAFGLWAGASPKYRHLVRGIEKADSWATDAHKWLNVPYESGVAFTAHPQSHQAAIYMPAEYASSDGVRDQFDWNPEWSRRARPIPIYAALRSMGKNGVAELIDRCCRLAGDLVEGLAALDGVEVLAKPVINQGLVRFLDSGTAPDHDVFTDKVVEQIQRDGEAWFGPTTWQGMRVMRISVSNWRTTDADIARTVTAVESALKTLRAR